MPSRQSLRSKNHKTGPTTNCGFKASKDNSRPAGSGRFRSCSFKPAYQIARSTAESWPFQKVEMTGVNAARATITVRRQAASGPMSARRLRKVPKKSKAMIDHQTAIATGYEKKVSQQKSRTVLGG